MDSKKTVLILPILMVVLVLLNIPAAAGATATTAQEETKRLQEEIASSRAALTKSTKYYQQTLSDVHEIDDKIRTNEAELNKTKAKIALLKRHLDNRMIYMYKTGPSSFLSVLVSSDDFTDFIARAKFIAYMAYADYELIQKAKTLRVSLEKQSGQLADAKAQRAEQLAAASYLRNEISQQLAMQSTKLAQLNDGSAGRNNRRLAMASTATMSRSYVSRGGGRGGASGGFVFPVNGPHSYVDTWGAGRSGGRRHKGTDIMSPKGTPVVACVSGTIERTSPYDRGLGGITIYLDGDDGNTYYYAHLNGLAAGISAGARVEAGQVIGSVGSTGNASASAPHLHFEIHKGGGSAVNPYATLRAAE